MIIDGVPEVYEEMTYYVGISGSQIPGFGFGIQKVKIDSPAEWAGLVAGDVIVSVNGKLMTDQELLAYALQRSAGVLDLKIASQGSDEVRLVRVVAKAIPISSF